MRIAQCVKGGVVQSTSISVALGRRGKLLSTLAATHHRTSTLTGYMIPPMLGWIGLLIEEAGPRMFHSGLNCSFLTWHLGRLLPGESSARFISSVLSTSL